MQRYPSEASPKFFRWAYVAGGFTDFAGALAVSVNTLLVALGATPLQISFAGSAKYAGQAISQIFGLHFLNGFRSHRKAQMWALSIEMFLKLGLAAVAFTHPTRWFFFVAPIVFLIGVSTHASFLTYYSWMGEIVPARLKDRFFANRKMAGEVLLIAGSLIASWVLKLDAPALFLLGCLYIASYCARQVEIASYLFHPNAFREKLARNHIVQRILRPLRDKTFGHFTAWYNCAHTGLLLNLLFLEFFIIRILGLGFVWVPVSFMLMSGGTIIGLFVFQRIFPGMPRGRKLAFISLLVALSSSIWLFSRSPISLILALLVAGIAEAAIKMAQRVEVINYAEGKDKEGYYAAFNTIEYITGSLAILAIGFLQKPGFSFNLVFCITIPLALLSLVFIRKAQT